MNQIFDIAVLGAGPSGIAAASYAAKFGAKTALFEKSTVIGGTAYKANVHTLSGGSLSSMDGLLKKIVKKAWGSVIFDPEKLLDNYYNILSKYDVKIFCGHTAVSINAENEHISSLVFSSETGKKSISAKIIIDASGQLEVENLTGTKDAGVTSYCYMSGLIGKVETVGGKCYSKEAKRLLEEKISYSKSNGGFSKGLFIQIQPTLRADIAQLIIKHENNDGVDGKIMREKMDEAIAFLQEFGYGFENASLIVSSKDIFYSAQGSFSAKYTLSKEDVANNKYFNEQVAILPDDDDDDERVYYIPYGSILSAKFDNLLLCGRNIGAAANAMEIMDSIPTHFETGKAAGIAAAIAIKNNLQLDNVSPYEIISKSQDSVEEKIEVLSEITGEEDSDDDVDFEIIQEAEPDEPNPAVQTIADPKKESESFEELDKALDLIGEDILGDVKKSVSVENIMEDIDIVMDLNKQEIIKKHEKEETAESIIDKMAGFTKSLDIPPEKAKPAETPDEEVKPFEKEFYDYDKKEVSKVFDSSDTNETLSEPSEILSSLFQMTKNQPSHSDPDLQTSKFAKSNNSVFESLQPEKPVSLSDENRENSVQSLIDENTKLYNAEKNNSLEDNLTPPTKDIVSNDDVIGLLYQQEEEKSLEYKVSDAPVEKIAQDELSLLYDTEPAKTEGVKKELERKDKTSKMLDMIYEISETNEEKLHDDENAEIPKEWISKASQKDPNEQPIAHDKFKSIKDFLYDNDNP